MTDEEYKDMLIKGAKEILKENGYMVTPSAETLGRDYEVIEYRYGGERWLRQPTGNYIQHNCTYPVKTEEELQYLRYPDYHIHSLRRLSDGEVFTVGKPAMLDNREIFIHEFKVQEDAMLVEYLSSGDKNYAYYQGITPLNELKRQQKRPLFTTEDEKPIFEGDDVLTVRINEDWGIHTWNNVSKNSFTTKWKYFSTREAADEYVLRNKPCLSYKEVEKYIDDYPPTFALAKLYSLVQSRTK